MFTTLLKDRRSLIEEILRLGKLSYDPSLPQDSQLRQFHIEKLRCLLNSTSTLSLLPVLTFLINSDQILPWLIEPLSSALAHLPLRLGGVQDTIEFILSVHPSTSSSDASSTGKGSVISHEALNAISRLLSSPPATVSAEVWFDGISPQLLSLLQGEGEPEMDRVAAFIIGFGILGKKHYGSPGRPGWKAFVEPIFRHLLPPSCDIKSQEQERKKTEIIETVRPRKLISSSLEVALSLQKLLTLLKSHPHPSLSIRLLKPIIYPLFTLSSWPHENQRTDNMYKRPAKKLLVILLQLWPIKKGPTCQSLIAKILDIITAGHQKISTQTGWTYAPAVDGGIQIERIHVNGQITNNCDLENIDHTLDFLITLLTDLPELAAEIPTLFLSLSSKWLMQKSQDITLNCDDNDAIKFEDFRKQLVEAKMMQKMLTALPDKLVDDSKQLLALVSQVLKKFNQSGGFESEDDNFLSITLSLLNTILTTPKFKIVKEVNSLIESIKNDLEIIAREPLSEISRTAGNLCMLLRLHDTICETDSNLLATEDSHFDQYLEEKKIYDLAMSYLSALDSPPPVRVQGLDLLSKLLQTNSRILDIPALVTLLMSVLGDNEEYVHLRVIQLIVQVSRKHPKTVMKDIIDRYVDSNEELGLDERLRLGEAIEQVIQTNSLDFKLETAQTVCQALLFLGGRRGYRPKTEQRQEREKYIQTKQNIQAEEAWGGPVPQLDESIDDNSLANEIFSQIVSGWESKRGSEDVRIRSSAITILGTAIRANIEGITSHSLSAAIDLSIHVLTLEPEVETAILRRAAILLILNLVRALDSARERGQSLKFGLVGQGLVDLQRILEYIESTDQDTLVRGHAKNALEDLENWQIKSVLPVKQMSINLENLSGLSISQGSLEGSSRRPKIEEVE